MNGNVARWRLTKNCDLRVYLEKLTKARLFPRSRLLSRTVNKSRWASNNFKKKIVDGFSDTRQRQRFVHRNAERLFPCAPLSCSWAFRFRVGRQRYQKRNNNWRRVKSNTTVRGEGRVGVSDG